MSPLSTVVADTNDNDATDDDALTDDEVEVSNYHLVCALESGGTKVPLLHVLALDSGFESFQ